MTNELAYNFLYNTNEFKEQFQRVLNRTPHERNASKVDFWIHFFSSISVTIQNTKLNSDSTHVKDISFSINNNVPRSKTKILKLAFKVNNNGEDKVILRSISIGENDNVPKNNKYSDNELQEIETLFWGDDARKTAATTIDLTKIKNSESLHLNIKTSQIKLESRNIQESQDSNGKFVKVQPLQLQGDETLDTTLDLIAIPAPIDDDEKVILQNNVETFFKKLIELYNTNKHRILLESEVAYHGFTYGVLVLNYHKRYAIDTYVEQSAGRGFLDLYFLLRKDQSGNSIQNAIKIITEFKGKESDIMSVADAIDQIKFKAYAALLGRTASNDIIMIGTNFGVIEKLQVTKPQNTNTKLQEQDFISMLIDERQVTLSASKIKQAVKNIFDSTRKDELLDKVIYGELLSNVKKINVVAFNNALSDKDAKRASIFVFENQYKNTIILSIIEQENTNSYTRDFLKDSSGIATRSNKVSEEVTIEQEVNEAILYIQKKLNINSGKRIDITINPEGDIFFITDRSAKLYYLDTKVEDLEAPKSVKQYISQFIDQYEITANIDLNNLIPALQHLDNISSPPHDYSRDIAKESEALNGLKEGLFKLKDFIALERDALARKTTEAHFKSVLHGLFLHKKYNGENIIVIPELSLAQGRADLVLALPNKSILALELGLGDKRNVPDKQQQLERYIAHLKTITDAKEAQGVALIFNKGAAKTKDIFVGRSFVSKVDHSTGEDSPIKPSLQSKTSQQALDNQPGPSGVQSEQKRVHSDDIHLDVSHQSKKLKLTVCLSDSDRKKREASFCKFSGEDIDKFSVKRTRDIDELQIDNKRFLEYLKDSGDQAKNSQLLELVKIRQIENSDNIVGNYKYLLDQVIQDGGYNNYRQNERMQDIAYNLAKNGFSGISTNLKNTIINAAGQIQLVRGTHGTIVACQTEGAERDCILSGLGLSYSFLSQPIEDIIVKQGSKFVIKVSKNFAQTVPRILGYNTKFVLKILSAKYGTVFLKGAAGGITGVFDIVDIALSAQALKECSDRADTDSKCSDREIRDNIASITFSGVSFVAGIVLTAASAGGPVTIGVALALMASYGIYSGVSAIVEYEEKYDTTNDENWRVFWHNFALQSPPEDVQHLAARTEAVNNIVKTAWQDLASMPANVVAYGGGFGKIRLEHFPKQCRTVLKYIQSVPGGGQVYVDECSPAYTKPYLESSSAIINMRWSSNDNNYGLSRILPNHINGATMTCLPKVTDAVYEKGGTSRSDSNVIYKCNNGFVIERDVRQNQSTKAIFVNSQLINPGIIVIGPDGLSGIFALSSHNVEINTFSHRNEFIFFHNNFPGTITISRYGTINIFNTGQLLDEIVTFNIEEIWGKINIFINGNIIKFLHYMDDLMQIQHYGRKHKADHIKCESRNNELSNSTNIFVDSGGGFNNQRQDIIKNCKKAIIWPYTKVEGNNGIYIFYIKTAGYEQQNSHSEINIIGKGTIIFLDTALLKDCEDITYSEASNTISLRIKLGEKIFYRLDIKNYLDKGSKIPNFSLIDKYGSNIIPKIEQDTTIVSKFELNIEKDVHASDTNDISVVKRYYRKISDKKINYELFGSIKYKEKYYLFGSDDKDIIMLDKHTQFALGGEESDIYIISNDMDMGTVIIDNGSRDKKLDILMVQSIDDVSLVFQGNNLNILLKKTNGNLVKIDNIIVRNYFTANWYKHLLLVDQEGKFFIPFFTTNKDLTLVPFYSCDINNMFEISIGSKVVLDCDLNNIEYYGDNDNLMLFNKNTDNPIITIEQFFNDSPLKLEVYHYTSKEKIILLKNNALNYYIFEYFSSDINIEDLRIEFTKWLNGSFVLSEGPLKKNPVIVISAIPQSIRPKVLNWNNFEINIKEGSSNVSVILNFVGHGCSDKDLRFHKEGNDIILLQKCVHNKTDPGHLTIRNFIPPRPDFVNIFSSQIGINDQPAINLIQKANNPKDYKEKIQELYNKIFKVYEIDFSKSFEITHNQQELANGVLIPVSSDQQRIGVVIFKDIIPYWVTLSQYNDDLIIEDTPRNTHIVIKNWFIDQNYIISTVEFDLGLEPIKIHKWNEDTNMIKGNNTSELLVNKLRLAEEINTSKSIYLRASLSGDELHTLKCVTIVNNPNSIVKSYEVLGFSSLEEQLNYVKNCKFTESSLVQLKTFMTKVAFYLCCTKSSDLVLPPPNMVNNRLALDVWYELALRGYNYQKASEIYNNISGEFDFDKIIENINKVQNALSNKPDEEVFQRNRRDVNVDDKFITSGASSILSPINELFNWFKNKYYFIFDQVKAPHIHTSKTTISFVGGEQEPRFKYTNDNQYNINDELANSYTYNAPRSFILAEKSASILEPNFPFSVLNKVFSIGFTVVSSTNKYIINKFTNFFTTSKVNTDSTDNYPYTQLDSNIKVSNTDFYMQNDQSSLFHNQLENNNSTNNRMSLAISTIDINGGLMLAQLASGVVFGKNKLLNNNSYLSPEQERQIELNELEQKVLSTLEQGNNYFNNSNYHNQPQWYQDWLQKDSTCLGESISNSKYGLEAW